ncbi:MAG TPA: alpha/beta fold hydrolase [Acetobacteraceae bacterium]|nr:alpha/beta fold hydrolase [Acetobacteraceae bacterium]
MLQPVSLLRRSAQAASAALLAAPATASESAPIREYQVVKTRDGKPIHLTMYRKRSGGTRLPVLFLVHGSSMSALSSFDLQVPGTENYSMMTAFSQAGFDVWTMDHEGYGKSDRTDGNSDIASGVEDLKAAVEIVQRETGQTRYHFLGESSGALRAAAYAMVAPERCGRLVLAAHTYTGKGSPTLAKRAENLEYFKTNNRRPRDKAMIESIFMRDRPGTTDPAVPAALVKSELVYGDTVPTGTYLDMTSRLPVVDPAKILSPVLVVRGEYDGIASMEDLVDFFEKLPNGDKQFSVIAGAAHALATCKARFAFWYASETFLKMPVLAD